MSLGSGNEEQSFLNRLSNQQRQLDQIQKSQQYDPGQRQLMMNAPYPSISMNSPKYVQNANMLSQPAQTSQQYTSAGTQQYYEQP